MHHAHSHKDVLEFLLEKLKADPVIRKWVLALETIYLLVTFKFCSFLGCSTLTLALRNGQKDVVDRLIRCQVDYQDTSIGVADMELTNLMAAVMSGRKDLCEQLISRFSK